MQKIILFVLVSICLVNTSVLADETSDELLVMLAYPKEAKISNKPCSFFIKDKNTVCMDGVIELVYEVGEVIAGNYDKKEIAIIDFVHHSGFPDYLSEFPVYLALIRTDKYYFLSQAAKLESINEFEWVCGNGLNPLISDDSDKAPPYMSAGVEACTKGVKFLELKKYFKEFNVIKRL